MKVMNSSVVCIYLPEIWTTKPVNVYRIHTECILWSYKADKKKKLKLILGERKKDVSNFVCPGSGHHLISREFNEKTRNEEGKKQEEKN